MIILDQAEADWANTYVLHCCHVKPGDVWDRPESWRTWELLDLAREVLRHHRRTNDTAIPEPVYRQLASACCA